MLSSTNDPYFFVVLFPGKKFKLKNIHPCEEMYSMLVELVVLVDNE